VTEINAEVVTVGERTGEKKYSDLRKGVEASLSLCQGEDCNECDAVLGST